MVKVPKAEGAHEGNSGFCYETKEDMKIKVDNPTLTSAHFADCIPGSTTELATPTDDLLEDILADQAECNLVDSAAVVQECSDLLVEDMLGCVLDGLEGCTAEDVEDLLQFEVDVIPYNCPALPCIDSTAWPLTSFDASDVPSSSLLLSFPQARCVPEQTGMRKSTGCKSC